MNIIFIFFQFISRFVKTKFIIMNTNKKQSNIHVFGSVSKPEKKTMDKKKKPKVKFKPGADLNYKL